MRRAFALAAVLVSAFAFTGACAEALPPARSASWLSRRLETELAKALGGSVRIGRIDVDWTTLAATVGDVAISVPADGAPPLTATISEGRVKLAWSGLSGIAAGQIHISEVVARGATFSCSREWIEAWRPRANGDGDAVEIRIDRLIVDDATAEYADHQQRVRVQARSVDFRGDWSTSRRLLVGEVHAQATVEAPVFDRPWPATVRGGLRWGGGRLEIFGATGEGPGATAELAGNVTWSAGASFTAEGRLDADLAALSPFVAGDLGFAGRVEGPVQIVFTGGTPIRVTMQAETKGLRIGPIAIDTARGRLTIRPGSLDIASLDARAYNGVFGGTVGLTFGQPIALQTDLHGSGADLGRLIALSGKEIPISCAAEVTLNIAGDLGRPATWIGGGTFAGSPVAGAAANERIPTAARGSLTFDSGRVRVDADPLDLAEASMRLRFDSEIATVPPATRLSLGGGTRSARATQLAALKILDALGVESNRFAVLPVAGSGRFDASARTGRKTEFDLSLALTDGSWSGERFTSGVLDIAVDATTVHIRRVELTREGVTVLGRARFDGHNGELDEVHVEARGVGIATLLAKAGLEAQVDGRVDLTLRGGRDRGVFSAEGHASASGVIVGHEIVDTIESPVRVDGNHIVLEEIVARGLGFAARGRLTYDMTTGVAEVDLDRARLSVARNRTLADAGLTAEGTIEARGPITITRDGPSGFLGLVATKLVLDTGRSGVHEVQLGDLSGTGMISPRGLELAVKSRPEEAWTLEGFLGFAPTLPLSAVLYFENLVVGAGGVLGESIDLRLKGQVQAEGDLTEPRAMQINGALDEIAVRLGSRVVRAVEPFPLRLESGRFLLGPTRFEGEGAALELGGSGSIEGGDVSGRVRGTVDLSVVSSVWSELRGSGSVAIDVTLGGTLARPDLQGHIALRDGRLRLLGHPQSLEAIDADTVLDGQTLTLTSFHALQGGGEVAATGRVDFVRLAPSTFHADVTGANVSVAFPEGFKGTYQGRVVVDGAGRRATIAGRFDLVRGLYARDFDTGLFGGAHREFDLASESPFPRNVFLDVDVVAPANLWLRNRLAKVEAAGQIHLGGELARPEVTGRLSLFPGGIVRYRNVDYDVEYGTLDLTDTKRINPYVDLRGRTRVAEYEISLRVEGTLDKFDYELTSTPPLPSQDIISLLVTGKTLDALSGSATTAGLPGDMAAYYFAGLLSSTFGKHLQSSLGIDQLEITPLLLKGESDPTARVTIGKQVSDVVKIVFSQDIGTAQKQTYQVVWNASRRVRAVAESDSRTGLGGELQYSRQFGGTPVGLREVANPAPSGRVVDPSGVVSAVQVVADDGVPSRELGKRVGIRPGEAFDRGRMFQGGDRIRAALLADGFIQASVRAEASSDDGPPQRYRITYRISTGPRINVEIVTGEGKRERGLRKALKAFWRDTPYTPEFWDEAAHALLDDLQLRGYFAADVTWHPQDGPHGRTIRFVVDRGKPVRLHAVRFAGVASIPHERIEKQMASLQGNALRKRLLRPSVLAEDLAGVRALYREEGFTSVRIGRPQIALAATGDSAEVDVVIVEGPRFVVGEVTFPDTAAASEGDLRAWTPLAPGETFSPRRLAESEQALKDRLDIRGFPDAGVESRVALAAPDADVAFDIVPGDRKTVGQIAFEGGRVTKEKTIRRAVTFGVGDLVSRNALLRSQQQLYRTGLFSSVKVTYAPADGDGGSAQRVTVRVEEAPPLTFGMGVGYDSEDGPRASVLLGYSNLAGRNVGIALQGLLSGKQRRALVTLRRRRVFGNTIDSLASILFERSEQSAFVETRRALSARFEQRPKPRWIRFLRYSIQEVRISNITDIQAALEAKFKDKLSDVRLADVGLGLVRDTRDDAFLPTRGGYGSIEGSVFAKPLASEESFVKLFLRGSWTVTSKRGSRFASFLRIGAEKPFADTELIPLSERFFAGGANTLRGFSTDSVGGLIDVPGFNAGGEALLLFNEEWHFPIWRSLRGELFLDAGNVYPRLADFDPTDLRSSAGVGLRLDTPIGPIRLEYGWKLDRKADETPGELIFAIGGIF